MLFLYLSMIDTQEGKNKFEKLYYKYKGLVHCIAIDYMSKSGLVEDAAQETFIKLIRYIDKIEDIDDHKTFSFVKIVTRSVCFDMLRKEKTRSVKEEQFFIAKEKYSDDKDFYVIIEKLMMLPEIYRDALMLKYFYGLDEKEIAFITNLSKDGIYKRLERAKTLLKEDI